MAHYLVSVGIFPEPSAFGPYEVNQPVLVSSQVVYGGSGSTNPFFKEISFFNGSYFQLCGGPGGSTDVYVTGIQLNPDEWDYVPNFEWPANTFGIVNWSIACRTAGSKTVRVRVYDEYGSGPSDTATFTVQAAMFREPGEVTPDRKLQGYAPLLLRPIVRAVPKSPDRILQGKIPVDAMRWYRGPARRQGLLNRKTPTVFRQNYAKPPKAGTRLLKGKNVLTFNQYYRSPAKVSRTLTGKVPTLLRRHYRNPAEITPDPVLAGKIPVATRTAHHWRTVGRRRLILTKEAPGYERGNAVWRGPGRVWRYLTGKVTDIQRTTNRWITVSRRQLYLTGKVPTLSRGYYIDPVNKGALSLSGKSLGFIVGYAIQPDTATLALASEKPILFGDVRKVRLTGKLPQAVYRRFMPVGGTSLALQEIVPDVVNGGVIPGLGGAVLSGQAPRVVVSSEITGKKGLISLRVRREIQFIGTPIDFLTS